ncbi:hypothetical protein SEA_MOLIVIA_86 [Arthrobacter phage Molivia]|uniref:Uncharacterized protein n=1 Tax=Arthrobacter phage Molivia TaxID=2015839 RepID=A0A286S1W7_9CAUD|nr:hypothetical protein FDI28_gp30 [Arthrobacter phage Molivia]ASX99307.1 hypothetical protein SEA_MOLIVIA_86 [Arthrobacter phage Molivia]
MKIKKKAMNKIHNEMVRRFSPYWDRKNVQMEELRADMESIRRQIEELKQLAEPKVVEEAPKSAGRHVANPEIPLAPELPEVWEAHFKIFHGPAVATVPVRYTYALKNLGIEFSVAGSATNPNTVRIMLLTTRFPGKVDALQEQMTRLMGKPVKVFWRKVQ